MSSDRVGRGKPGIKGRGELGERSEIVERDVWEEMRERLLFLRYFFCDASFLHHRMKHNQKHFIVYI